MVVIDASVLVAYVSGDERAANAQRAIDFDRGLARAASSFGVEAELLD